MITLQKAVTRPEIAKHFFFLLLLIDEMRSLGASLIGNKTKQDCEEVTIVGDILGVD